MKCLVVIAHPRQESLCHSLAAKAIEKLRAAGHEVLVQDIYGNESTGTAASGKLTSNLLAAEGIVLCFPTWWYGFPAVLKDWFDRVWGPGVAFDPADQHKPVKPRLRNLREVLAVTTLGSTWWVDSLVMRQPVKRILKNAILRTCAPTSRFAMLSLYKCQGLNEFQVERFASRIENVLGNWS